MELSEQERNAIVAVVENWDPDNCIDCGYEALEVLQDLYANHIATPEAEDHFAINDPSGGDDYIGIAYAGPCFRFSDGFMIAVDGHGPLSYTRYEVTELVKRMQEYLDNV